jgi:hypothetical protein
MEIFMIYISHRGNLDGKNVSLENKPDYVEGALREGYDVEVDVWFQDNKWYLGHDEATYRVDFSWIDKHPHLWLHCKNLEALAKLAEEDVIHNYFWHETDKVTLTSNAYIWAYPNVKINSEYAITVLPELDNTSVSGFGGICSDVIESYKIGS